MSWIDDAMKSYFSFLQANVTATPLDNGWYTITTPFLNMFNDCIEIYCKNNNGTVTLTDDGETLRNLSLLEVHFKSKQRKDLLNQILFNYGVTRDTNDRLMLSARLENFAQAKHNFLSAISAVSDMFILSRGSAHSFFNDDIEGYFNEQNIIYTPNFIAKGSSGLEFNFAFQIAGRTDEILVNSFNKINRDSLTSFLFNWQDIRDARSASAKKSVRGLAIINDADHPVDPKYLDALSKLNTDYILFTQRNQDSNIKKIKAA